MLTPGKFSYRNYEDVDRTLGPTFFLYFNVIVNLFLMNMTISILDDAYHRVKQRVRDEKNEYELLDYVTATVKGWLGMEDKRETIVGQEITREGKTSRALSRVTQRVNNQSILEPSDFSASKITETFDNLNKMISIQERKDDIHNLQNRYSVLTNQ